MAQTMKLQKLSECNERFPHRHDVCDFVREAIEACAKEDQETIRSLNKLVEKQRLRIEELTK